LDKNKNHALGFIPFIPCITVKYDSKKLYLTGMKGIQGITSKPNNPCWIKTKIMFLVLSLLSPSSLLNMILKSFI